MMQSSVMWIDASETAPLNNRTVLVVIAKNWEVDTAQYRDGRWMVSAVPASVAYWADFPYAPPPPNYRD